MSDVIVDAGGHDHGGHFAHGGDGAGLAQMLGVNDHHHAHQGILGHLFSQEGGHDHGIHGSHSGHHHHHTGELSATPQGSVSWSSAIRSMKLSDALQGINITPNMLFLFLFFGFAVWLYVVYWVRHNEPLANQVLGTATARSPGTHVDRQIVNRVRNAFPVRTGPTTGMIYVPNSSADSTFSYPTNAQPMSTSANPTVVSGTVQAPVHQQAVVSGGMAPALSAYHVSVQTPDGLKLKTVVNR
ncbi:MAG: hypothetical protein HY711_00305 [Candidatus Melainabacteria bacterium]|nr:hypothetical protein [Candidatus Melainabacteria bacterium]